MATDIYKPGKAEVKEKVKGPTDNKLGVWSELECIHVLFALFYPGRVSHGLVSGLRLTLFILK